LIYRCGRGDERSDEAPWLKFAVCAILIGVAGPILTHYADKIARLTGLSRSWVGLVLLAGATSLPELFTGVSAVAVAAAPNIALGDALGSCIFNLAMLVVLDVMSRNEPVYRYIDHGHILTAGFGVILIGFVGALLLVGRDGLDFRLARTPIIIVLYLVAIRAAFVYERRSASPPATANRTV
jgi:cation:H+ antiporter